MLKKFQLEDCVKGMNRMPDFSVDVVVTSPPYNLGIEYAEYNDKAKRSAYLDWTEKWLESCRRVMKPNSSMFLNLGGSPSNPLLPYEVVPILIRTGWVLQNTIHWIKTITVPVDGKDRSFGHFKPINSPRYLNDGQEFIFHCTLEGKTPIDRLAVGVEYADKSNLTRGNRGKNGDRRCRGNVWFIPYSTIQRRDQRPHPATFPVELAARCFQLHGITPGCVAMDPFLGIGNAAVAAQRCGIDEFIGYEIDKTYLDQAVENTNLTSENL